MAYIVSFSVNKQVILKVLILNLNVSAKIAQRTAGIHGSLLVGKTYLCRLYIIKHIICHWVNSFDGEQGFLIAIVSITELISGYDTQCLTLST